jgi:hypothetical protein
MKAYKNGRTVFDADDIAAALPPQDWQENTRRSDLMALNGATLRAACAAVGERATGTKSELVTRLRAHDLECYEVRERWGWQARQASSRTGDPS